MILLIIIAIVVAFLGINAYIDTIISGGAVLICIAALVVIGIRKSREKSRIEENKHMENKPDDDITIRYDS